MTKIPRTAILCLIKILQEYECVGSERSIFEDIVGVDFSREAEEKDPFD